MSSSKLVFAIIFGAAFIASAAAQETEAEIDAYLAQPDPQGCQIGPQVCTCSIQEVPIDSAAKCTRPISSDSAPPGVCEQQTCNESYKCDCFGYETCQINSCGQWKPTSPLPEPAPERYSCEYTADATKCRKYLAYQEDTSAADNAKDQAVDDNIDTVVEETEVVQIVAEMCAKKANLLKKMKEADIPTCPREETAALETEVEEFISVTTEIDEALVKIFETRKLVHEQQKQAKLERLAAKEAGEKEKEEQAKLDLVKDDPVCPKCLELKKKVAEFRRARRAAAIAAGTWSRKGRGGKHKVRKAKTTVKEKKLTAEEIEVRCVARAQRILANFA